MAQKGFKSSDAPHHANNLSNTRVCPALHVRLPPPGEELFHKSCSQGYRTTFIPSVAQKASANIDVHTLLALSGFLGDCRQQKVRILVWG